MLLHIINTTVQHFFSRDLTLFSNAKNDLLQFSTHIWALNSGSVQQKLSL